MAKVSVELEIDEQTLEEVLAGLRAVENLAKTTTEMLDDLQFLSKTISANQREMKKLTTSVTTLLKEVRNGDDAGSEG
jgi:DNA repair ATPase RecN